MVTFLPLSVSNPFAQFNAVVSLPGLSAVSGNGYGMPGEKRESPPAPHTAEEKQTGKWVSLCGSPALPGSG